MKSTIPQTGIQTSRNIEELHLDPQNPRLPVDLLGARPKKLMGLRVREWVKTA